jgi:hypothetical protein
MHAQKKQQMQPGSTSVQTRSITRTGGKSNLPGLCFTLEKSGVIRFSSAEAGARAAAEEHHPLGKSSILNLTESR